MYFVALKTAIICFCFKKDKNKTCRRSFTLFKTKIFLDFSKRHFYSMLSIFFSAIVFIVKNEFVCCKLVVSIGLFLFCFVSFPYNGVYFLRINFSLHTRSIYKCTLLLSYIFKGLEKLFDSNTFQKKFQPCSPL